MYKFIQRNQKKMLAVFGVVLMIAFIIPTTFKNGGAGRGDQVVGKVGDFKVLASDEEQARHEIQLLKSIGYSRLFTLGAPSPSSRDPDAKPEALAAFEQHPLLFALLQREAQQEGIQVSDEQLKQVREQILPKLRTRGSQIDPEDVAAAIEHLMLVDASYQRAASNVKVTSPQVRLSLARENRVKLNVVELNPARFREQVPAPTAEKVREYYDKYAGVVPGPPTSCPTARRRPATSCPTGSRSSTWNCRPTRW